MYCNFCGRKIDDDSLYCEFCGQKLINDENNNNLAANETNITSDKKAKIAIVSVIGSFVLIGLIVLIVVLVSNNGNHSISGKWYSAYDKVFDFKESGNLIIRDDRLDYYETKYYISGDMLHIDKCPAYKGGDFTYSESAKQEKSGTWFLETDTLYIETMVLYKK